MHPLIPIIRWWLWQAAAIAATLWLPEAGLALFAGNCFGWWTGDGCCPSPSTACGAACNSPWSTISVTFAGYVAGSCDCTVLNATWAVPYFADFSLNHGCLGILEPFPCGDENGDGVLRADVFTSSTTLNPNPHTGISIGWYCQAGSGIQEAFIDTSTLDPSPIDCTSITSMSIPKSGGSPCHTALGICNGTSATCSVTITA